MVFLSKIPTKICASTDQALKILQFSKQFWKCKISTKTWSNDATNIIYPTTNDLCGRHTTQTALKPVQTRRFSKKINTRITHHAAATGKNERSFPPRQFEIRPYGKLPFARKNDNISLSLKRWNFFSVKQ